ncbi:MAG: hypothetical protein ABSC54_10040 [Smithellaceae bacterium]|jgi:hypothetical protein
MNEVIDVTNTNIDVPAIGDSTLLKLAEQADKRVQALNTIKKAALMATNARDWTDQSGHPYLQVSGSEKVARVFGISWRIDEPLFEQEESGHFAYTYKGYFTVAGATIEAIGTRSSKDPFFKRYIGQGEDRKELPPSEIDKGDLKKAAYTNLLGNGITRLLGLRNLTWPDLAEFAGIKKDQVNRIDYKKSGKDKEEIKSEGALIATIGIADIRKQTGENAKTKKPWTKFVIKGSDGNEYSTFSETTATAIKEAQGAGLNIEVTYLSDKFGNTIESIKKIEPEREAGQEG